MEKLNIKTLLISLLTLNSLAGEFRFSIESSGPYKYASEIDISKVDDIVTAFEDSKWQRHKLTKDISNCTLETCESLFLDPLVDIRNGLVDQMGEAKGNSYFLTMLSGMIVSNNTTLREKAYATGNFSLTFQEKMFVGQNLGEIMARNYDYDRTDTTNEASEGIVSVEDVYQAIREGTDAGVCRDIATAQAHALKNLGIEGYVVAFPTIDGGHATYLAQNDENPSEIYQLNYGELTAQQRGVGMFNQDTTIPDAGIKFRVYDADGQAIDSVSSEVGYVLLKTAGMDPERFSAGVSREGIHLTKMDYKTGKVTVTGVGAMTANGSKMVAGGVNYTLGSNDKAEMIVSMAFHNSSRENGSFNLEQKGFLIGLQSRLRTDKLDLGFLKRNFVEVDFGGSFYFGDGVYEKGEYSDAGKVSDSHVYANLSYQGDIDILDNVIFRNRTTVHSAYMKSDVRDEGSHFFQYTGVTVSNSILVQIGEKYKVEVSNKVYVRNGGTTMSNDVYLMTTDGRNAIQIGYANPLTEKANPWMIGAQKEARLGLHKKIGKFELDFKYIRLIELKENVYNMQVRGRF